MDNIYIQERSASLGLTLRGAFRPDAGDGVPLQASQERYALVLMFGQVGSSIWPQFSSSAEYVDGLPDPMDRWSRRIGSLLADELSGLVLFPFDGPPWYPFGHWAQKAESIQPSPLGMLMNPQYGLWHAYRCAIALPVSIDLSVRAAVTDTKGVRSQGQKAPDNSMVHACSRCDEKPCLDACPVNAFTDGTYDVAACCHFLNTHANAVCHHRGCIAREACPEGQAYRYEEEHRRFHIQQFLIGMNSRTNECDKGDH